MKTIIILALLCFVGSFAYKENLLKSNKTPKEVSQFSTVCDECQQVVKRFAEAAKDPAKMAALKELLSLMCHETSYEEECRVFVSKLDLFIDKLLPYLKDTEQICRRFRMCSNSKIDQFHRVGLLFAKKYLNEVDGAHDLICEECQFAAHELQQVIDDHDTQQQIRTFISKNVCSHLGQYRGPCDVVVDDFLPDLFQELHDMLKNSKQFCVDLKLCSPKQIGYAFAPRTISDIKHSFNGPKRLRQFKNGINMLKTKQPEVLMSCLECKITIDALLIELRTDESVTNIANDIINGVCPGLPADFLLSCQDFLGMYGPTVVNMTLYQFTAESICISMHSCPNTTSFAAAEKLSRDQIDSLKCEACTGISEFINQELSDAGIRDEIVHGLKHAACQHVPNAFYFICQNLAKSYIPLALTKVEQALADQQLCKKVHACNA